MTFIGIFGSSEPRRRPYREPARPVSASARRQRPVRPRGPMRLRITSLHTRCTPSCTGLRYARDIASRAYVSCTIVPLSRAYVQLKGGMGTFLEGMELPLAGIFHPLRGADEHKMPVFLAWICRPASLRTRNGSFGDGTRPQTMGRNTSTMPGDATGPDEDETRRISVSTWRA